MVKIMLIIFISAAILYLLHNMISIDRPGYIKDFFNKFKYRKLLKSKKFEDHHKIMYNGHWYEIKFFMKSNFSWNTAYNHRYNTTTFKTRKDVEEFYKELRCGWLRETAEFVEVESVMSSELGKALSNE